MKHFFISCFLAIVIAMGSGQAFAASQEMAGSLDFKLPIPESKTHKEYLGLASGDHFSLGEIRAEVVIIEIFSMYCPVCQREAKEVNALFDLIQSSPKLKEKVRLIGIGAGNSAFEVNFFKEKYDIEFPLFSDADFVIHKQIGEFRTPHFFGLDILDNNKINVFHSESGEIQELEAFLETIIQKSKLKSAP